MSLIVFIVLRLILVELAGVWSLIWMTWCRVTSVPNQQILQIPELWGWVWSWFCRWFGGPVLNYGGDKRVKGCERQSAGKPKIKPAIWIHLGMIRATRLGWYWDGLWHWVYLITKVTVWSMSASDANVPMMEESAHDGKWDQFAVNKEMFGASVSAAATALQLRRHATNVLFPPSQRTKVWRFNHMAWGWKCFETSISSNAWKPLKIGRQINLLCRTGWCCVPAAVDTRISTQPSWTKAKFRKTSGTRLAGRDQAPSLRSSLALVDMYISFPCSHQLTRWTSLQWTQSTNIFVGKTWAIAVFQADQIAREIESGNMHAEDWNWVNGSLKIEQLVF